MMDDLARPPDAPTSARLLVIMFTDLVDSTAIKEQIGPMRYRELKSRHDEFVKRALAIAPTGRVLSDTGDGYFLSFASVADAVVAALRFQQLMRDETWTLLFGARVGLHLGEVQESHNQVTERPEFVSSAIDIGSRVMSLGRAGQILLTRLVFDAAQHLVREHPPCAEHAPPALKWMSHGTYQLKGATELMEVFEVGAEEAAPFTAPVDSEKAKRVATHPRRPFRQPPTVTESSLADPSGHRSLRRFLPGRTVLIWMTLILLALAGAGWAWRGRRDPFLEMRRAEVERKVQILKAEPPLLLKASSSPMREVDLVERTDNPSFNVLSDERTFDLRAWKETPANKVSELYSATTMHCRRRLKKIAPADLYETQARTTGLDLFWRGDEKFASTIEAQKGESFVGLQRMKVHKHVVDVSSVPVGRTFELEDATTFWNALWSEDDQWYGVIGYKNSFSISMLLLFPEEKPFTKYTLMVAATSRDKPVAFTGPRIVLTGVRREWIYWEIPNPEAGRVYRVDWKW